jgi:hypothetical protein
MSIGKKEIKQHHKHHFDKTRNVSITFLKSGKRKESNQYASHRPINKTLSPVD